MDNKVEGWWTATPSLSSVICLGELMDHHEATTRVHDLEEHGKRRKVHCWLAAAAKARTRAANKAPSKSAPPPPPAERWENTPDRLKQVVQATSNAF